MSDWKITAFMAALAVTAGCAGTERNDTVKYSYAVTNDAVTGWNVVTLEAAHPSDPGKNISIKVSPEAGSNLFSFVAGGHEIIDASESLKDLPSGGRGCFIMYPSPNRVRDGVFEFGGARYSMLLPGEKTHNKLHGLVRDDTAWTFDEPVAGPDGVSFRTRYVFDKANPRFAAFPFENVLTVEFTVMKDRVRVGYTVENTGDKPLGYGFGLHPFWKAIGGREKCRIRVAIPDRMVASPDLLPTGAVENVAGTDYDLMTPKTVSSLGLDDVYIGSTPESAIDMMFDEIGMTLRQRATADFTHVVVYTPKRDYFCVENQTCSTDAHNLYARGLVRESHLIVLEPGATSSGHIDFIVEISE